MKQLTPHESSQVSAGFVGASLLGSSVTLMAVGLGTLAGTLATGGIYLASEAMAEPAIFSKEALKEKQKNTACKRCF